MNNKGFTFVELLATLVVLGIIVSIVLVSVNGGYGDALTETEDVFVETIKDAMSMYLNGDKKDSNGEDLIFNYECEIKKTYGEVSVYKATTNFQAVINSKYNPITQSDLVNPANEEKCKDASSININIYRDEDFVYYYSINKSQFGCLTQSGKISNLPESEDDECELE